jgi:L-rhamnose isomerase
VVTVNDDTLLIAQEIVRCNALDKVYMGLDFFDASINRIGAYVVGTRAALQTMLFALLEPGKQLLEYENNGQLFERLALLELMKTKPFGAIWDYYCLQQDVPVSQDFITEIQQYEKEVLSKR